MIAKNQKYTVSIENTTVNGYGVCRVDGYAVFVPGTLAGEVWEILILKVTNTAVWAKGIQCLNPSPERMENDCPNPCGGCVFRHAEYAAELEAKRKHVEDCLCRIGNQNVEAVSIHPSPSVARYRNKAVFAVGIVDGKTDFGFYRPRSHEIIPVKDCLLQSERCIQAAKAMTDFMNRNRIPPYDEATGKGTLRHLFYRETRSGDAVVCIISARGFGSRTNEMVQYIREVCPELTGIVLNINKTAGNTVLAGDFYTLWGEPNVHENFCGYNFRISPQAFLQVNPEQAETIYRKALEFATLTERVSDRNVVTSAAGSQGNQLALELYCGAGTLSLCLSRSFQRVLATEIIPEAVENACWNAAVNEVHNVEFVCADAAEVADRLSNEGLRPDVVLVDPPRKGLTEPVISSILRMQPNRIVYISCNPATLARDMKDFSEAGYHLKQAEAYDMFPRTGHVETVVLMSRVER